MQIENIDYRKIKRLIQSAREFTIKADSYTKEALELLEDIGIDLYVPTEAENADTLEQAISCYIQYNEYNIDDIMREIVNNEGNL